MALQEQAPPAGSRPESGYDNLQTRSRSSADWRSAKKTTPSVQQDLRKADDTTLLQVSDGAVDMQGRPSLKASSGNWKACCLIFGE
jgi:hypothetical protein